MSQAEKIQEEVPCSIEGGDHDTEMKKEDDIFEDFKSQVKIGNIEQVSNLIQTHQELKLANKLDPQSRQTVLYLLSDILDETSALQMADLILSKGVDINFLDNYQQTAIFYIVRDGKLGLYKKFFQNKANINQLDINGQSPVFFGAANNRLDVVKQLISDGCQVFTVDSLFSQTPLFYAAKNGFTEMCRIIVEAGCDPNHLDDAKKNALFYAKKFQNKQTVEYLQTVSDKENKSGKKDKVIKQNSKKQIDVNKQEYKLVYTNENHEQQELNEEQLNRFYEQFPDIKELIQNPDQVITQEMIQKFEQEDNYTKVANRVLKELNKQKGAYLFQAPVDPIKFNIPDYPDIIKTPMDFSTIKNNIQYNRYINLAEIVHDLHLVFDNCIKYNGDDSEIGQVGLNMKKIMEQKLEENNYQSFM